MNRAVILIVLALALPGLAGCLTKEAPAATVDAADLVSQVRYGDVIAEHTPIPSFDGTIIDAWVFRPDTSKTGETVPVIINFSPYWSNLAAAASTGGDAFSLYLIDYFVPRGYAAALVSARGTGLSEGCFTIGGPLELQDEDVVATYLATLPWSNGNVTASGKSYDGTMAQGLLTMNNPYVKTIVPVSPISEFYKYNAFDGVNYPDAAGVNTFNTDYVLGTSLSQGASTYTATNPDPSNPTYSKTATRFCDESAGVQTNQYQTSTTGDYTPYWQARNYTALLPDVVDASVFYIHGLGDWNVKPDHMVPWIDELHARNVTVKMWLGQWAHDYPTRDDWNMTMLRWLDHYLKGIDTGILNEPLVQVQDNQGVWRNEQNWPSTRAVPTSFYPTEAGALQSEPTTGGGSYLDAPGPGVPVANPVGGQAALFYSTTLTTDTRLVGAPIFNALVASAGKGGTMSLTLYLNDDVINQGFLDLGHRKNAAQSEPMTPGAFEQVTVKFYPQDVLLPAGSKLTLMVGHTSPPRAPVTVGPVATGNVIGIDLSGTRLVLPLIAAGDISPEARQPEDVGCWAC